MSSTASRTTDRSVRFGELAICVNDRIDNPSEAGVERYVGLEHLDSDSLRIRRWGVPSDVEATKLLFRKGDIIFGRRRAYQRKLAVAEFDGICSAHAMVLRARSDVILPEFLPFFMQSDLFMERALAMQVYVSVQPTTGTGRLIWHSLGAKTIELIHQNVHVDAVRDDLDKIVLDAELLQTVLGTPDPKKKSKELEIKISKRLRRHQGNPAYKTLSERLEALKERHEQGQLHSVQFLKELLDLARELLEAEKATPPDNDEDRGRAALTELFGEARNKNTPLIVERVVNDIDEIVRLVRFPGWQHTSAGEREVKKALRKTLFKYKLHGEDELFEKAYGYIKQYY
jgi:hypothetical protein